MSASSILRPFKGQLLQGGSFVQEIPFFMATWGDGSVDGSFASPPASNSDNPTGTAITINGVNQIWQARYPFNSDGTERTDFFPYDDSSNTYYNTNLFIICGNYANQITLNGQTNSINRTRSRGLGVAIMHSFRMGNMYEFGTNTRNAPYSCDLILKDNLIVFASSASSASALVRCLVLTDLIRSGAADRDANWHIIDCIAKGISDSGTTRKRTQLLNSIIDNCTLTQIRSTSVGSQFTPISLSEIADNYINDSTLTFETTNTYDENNILSSTINTGVDGGNNIASTPNFNASALNDYTVLPTSPHFRAGEQAYSPHIARAILGIPIYNATGSTSKDASLPTITANGFAMSTYKDLNAAVGSTGLNFRIPQINLVGAEDLTIDFDSWDGTEFTLGGSHDAPTDETGATNNGTGTHLTGFVGGYFTFRKADGTTASKIFLPFNVPIGYDDAGLLWGESGFAGTVVKVGNRHYSDFAAWSAGSYSSGDYVEHNGKPYKANTGTSEEPGTGSDWDTWNAYIEAAEVLVELKYPNGGGLSFKGITFLIYMNSLNKLVINDDTGELTVKTVNSVTLSHDLESSDLTPTYDNGSDEADLSDTEFGWGDNTGYDISANIDVETPYGDEAGKTVAITGANITLS